MKREVGEWPHKDLSTRRCVLEKRKEGRERNEGKMLHLLGATIETLPAVIVV